MERLVKGAVVAVPFPFSDLSGTKKRPALILAAMKYGDFILCQITSKANDDENRIPLAESDFEQGSLKRPSFIRPSRLFTAHRSLIAYTIGLIRPAKLKETISMVCRILER